MSGPYQTFFKPTLDALLAMAILILFSWLIILVLAAYLLSVEFPIFFRQSRMGLNQKPFTMWKFRTLRTNESLPLTERKFELGNFLRVTSLDELPQIWNILRGEMSWIGPRALPVEYTHLFSPEQKFRFDVKPGITGWAQVNGRNSISWASKFEFDKYYVRHLSFSLDLKILVRTVMLIWSFRKDVSLDEEPFRGNQ